MQCVQRLSELKIGENRQNGADYDDEDEVLLAAAVSVFADLSRCSKEPLSTAARPWT